MPGLWMQSMFGARVGMERILLRQDYDMLRRDQLMRTGRKLLLAATVAVSVIAGFAQVPTSAATVVEMSGRVDVLRDNSPRALPVALFVGNAVMPRQIVKTGIDGFARFRVSDGSTFDVFPNSTVTFRVNPQNWGDLLEVVLGRVKVYIQKLNGVPNPNKVTTPTAVISVRGTIFQVEIEDDEYTTLVSVEEGEVGVRHAKLGGAEVSLLPGDAVRVYASQPLARKQIDRGNLAERSLRAAAQMFLDIMSRRQTGVPGGSGGGTVPGGGTVGSGDHDKPTGGTTGTGTGTTPAPPPSAPPAPPPPPPE
jgi:hypothetical protein